MAQYRAIVIHPDTGGKFRYDFTGDADLMTPSPVKVMRQSR